MTRKSLKTNITVINTFEHYEILVDSGVTRRDGGEFQPGRIILHRFLKCKN